MNPRNIIMRCWDYLAGMPRLLPLFVFAITMLLTGLSTIAFERSERGTQQLRLQVKADEIAAGLEQNMATNVAILRSGRALFATLNDVNRDTFDRYVTELRNNDTRLGIRAIGWSAYAKVADIPAIEAKMRAQGIGDFRAWPRPEAGTDMTHIILYIEAIDDAMRPVLGYNMASEPLRGAAITKAAQSGLAVATAPIVLLVDSKHTKTPGIIVFVPVYDNNLSDNGLGKSSPQLKGFVYSAIRVADFIKAININRKELDASLALYDLGNGSRQMVYASAGPTESDFSASQNIKVADRKWQLVLHAKRDSYLAPLAAVILTFGVALSLLLGTLTALILLGGRNAELALRARQEYETVRNVLTRELTHRVKNTLATVTSLAMLTRRGATSVESYADALTARLRALSATHDLLTHRDWESAPLRDVLEAEFKPYSKASDVRLNLSGPDVLLGANIALSLGLAIHELVTNAAKYGAFSVPGGVISIDWIVNSAGNSAQLRWQESGGPHVEKPTVRGFGSDLVEKLMARELNSDVRIQFNPEGVSCTLNVPILKTAIPAATSAEAS